MGDAAKMIVQLTVDELREMIRGEVANAIGNPSAPTSRYMDAQQLAAHYSVSEGTVLNWVRKEGCPHLKRGRVLRFEIAVVEAWIRGRSTPTLTRVK